MSLDEFSLIARLLAQLPGGLPGHVRVGAGDDCAVSQSCGALLRLCSTDLLIEGTHFRRELIDGPTLGAKALAVNLSDIAAMGGEPLEAYVSLALPAPLDLPYLEGLYRGLGAEAARHGVAVLGGDTTRSPGPLVINIAIIGQVAADEVLLRSGARAGDVIYVSGTLGDSAAGLRALLAGETDAEIAPLIARHLRPEPRLALARLAAGSGLAHAAIDLSDGLSSDLRHVCQASGVGAEIDVDALPYSAALQAYGERAGFDPLALALHGGEDYQLLICGTTDLADALPELRPIGRIVAESGQWLLQHGERSPLPAQGWDHFSSC